MGRDKQILEISGNSGFAALKVKEEAARLDTFRSFTQRSRQTSICISKSKLMLWGFVVDWLENGHQIFSKLDEVSAMCVWMHNI